MLPFALDQMIEASAEELSAAVQWHYWGFYIALLIKHILECVNSNPKPAPIPGHPSSYLPHFRHSMFVSCFDNGLPYHKCLDTNNTTGNPIKLIFQVLNYARKNKCPRLRSALRTLTRNTLHVLTLGSTSLEDHSQKKRWRMSRQYFVS